jgi:hypothetical protein
MGSCSEYNLSPCVELPESGIRYWDNTTGGSVTDLVKDDQRYVKQVISLTYATTPKDGMLLFVISQVIGISNTW